MNAHDWFTIAIVVVALGGTMVLAELQRKSDAARWKLKRLAERAEMERIIGRPVDWKSEPAPTTERS